MSNLIGTDGNDNLVGDDDADFIAAEMAMTRWPAMAETIPRSAAPATTRSRPALPATWSFRAAATIREVIEHGRNGLLFGFFDNAGLSDLVVGALADEGRHAALRQAARRTVVERFDLASVCLPRWCRLIGFDHAARGGETHCAALVEAM